MRTTKRKLSAFSVGNNVIILILQYDRGPTDSRNILDVIEEVSEYGYRVGTSVGTLSGYLCRNQIEAVNDTSLSISMILFLQISLREAVRKISKNWRSGLSELQVQRWLQNFKMQVQKKNILCNSRCHGSMTYSNK